MIGFSLVGILIAGIISIFIFMNLSLNSSEKAIKLIKQSTPSSTSLATGNQLINLDDKKASFAIFTNGTFRQFSASMYHNRSSDVYLKSDNPNIIHVKKSGITYDDFFKTLPFKLTKDCLTTGTGQTFCTSDEGILKFYLNGRMDENLLEREIQNKDKLLITFGPKDDMDIQLQLQQIPNP